MNLLQSRLGFMSLVNLLCHKVVLRKFILPFLSLVMKTNLSTWLKLRTPISNLKLWYGHNFFFFYFPLKYLGYILVAVINNSNWDKISHSLAKKINIWNRVQLTLRWKKRIKNQILLSKLWYISQIFPILKFIIKELRKTIAQLPIW